MRRGHKVLRAAVVVVAVASPRALAQPAAIARADSLFSAGAREAARRALDELIESATVRHDSSLLRDALLTRGRHAASLNRAVEAAPDLERAELLARRTGETSLARNAVRWWGYTQLGLGNLDAAQLAYDRLLAESLSADDSYHEAHARFGAAYIDLLAGRRVVARRGYERAIEIFRRLSLPREEMFVLVGLARVLADDGDVRAARVVYGDIVHRSRELGLQQPQAQALNNLAILEFQLGSGDRAIENYRAAIDLYTRVGEAGEILGASSNLAMCLYSLGRYDEAEALLDSTLARTEAAAYPDRLQSLLILRCDVARSQGNIALAESCLSSAFAISTEKNVSDRLSLLLARARTHIHSDPARASVELERDARQLRQVVGRLELAGLDLQRARLLFAAGSFPEALHVAREAAESAAKSQTLLTRLPALTLAARAAHQLGDRPQATALLDSALATWESIRGTPRDPEWRERWGALSRELAGEFVAQLLDLSEPASQTEIEATFAILQRFKARTFVERLTGFGALAGGDSLRAQAMGELSDLRALQSILRPDEALLDLHQSEAATAVFVLTKDGLALHRIPAQTGLVERAGLLWQVVAQPATGSPQAVAAAEVAIRSFAEDFLDAIADATQQRKLLIAPDQAWYAVPFEAMAELLGASELQLTRIPSAQVLLQLRSRRQHQTAQPASDDIQGLLIASSTGAEQALRGSLSEARDLAARWKNLRAEIDTPLELSELEHAGWLHFASHADADPQRPWNSALHVRLDSTSTRELTAHDILSLPLDARLCVLSACESAAAQVLPGEGMLGLASAFLIAGSDAVVAALWKVDDVSTADFMQVFYEALADGQSTAGALGVARSAIRSRAATRHPYYWAGFCLIGDPAGTIPLRAAADRRGVIGLAGLLLLVGGAVIFRRRRAL